MTRTTNEYLDKHIRVINTRLPKNRQINRAQRNGYHALELGGGDRVIESGMTKKELARVLHALEEVTWAIEFEKSKED